MIEKTEERKKAIHLRKQGKTYSEIMEEVSVAKSTLSLWFRDVDLSRVQKQRITKKKLEAAKRGGLIKRNQRILITDKINKEAYKRVGSISKRELWLIGIVLYWAEGSKQKEWNVSQPMQFTNSDPEMIKLYIEWLKSSLNVPMEDIVISLSIHESSRHRLDEVISHWEGITRTPGMFSDRVYFKHHKPKSNRLNTGDNYYGSVRIVVRRSTNLNRKVSAWAKVISSNCRLV